MSISRILIVGKNRDFPKTVRIPFGVGVDGAVISKRVQIRADEALCKHCSGWGHIDTWDGNPSSREVSVPCPVCDGDSIVKVAA